ncbi:MAG: hypothetical protein PHZ05_00100, partial [Pygmaiobacter massiliensis]|nr:hypothetical protein [Pygmaiobacter massiliensis]
NGVITGIKKPALSISDRAGFFIVQHRNQSIYPQWSSAVFILGRKVSYGSHQFCFSCKPNYRGARRHFGF